MTQRPRVECRRSSKDGRVHAIELHVPEIPDAESRDAIIAILRHEVAKDVRQLSIGRSIEEWPRPAEVGFGWVLEAIADAAIPIALDQLFVHGPETTFDAIARFTQRPTRLGTYTKRARFGDARFAGIERLDLRDSDVDWSVGEDAFPDLTTLILRPRGPRSKGAGWVSSIFARPEAMPRLRELRAPEALGDDVLERLVASPLLERLRILDFTDALTNRGARVLHDSAAALAHIEELRIGSSGRRRREWKEMARAQKDPTAPPPGELEISDDWRSRLRQAFGRRVHFRVPDLHPDL